jgi:RimJ/RimL family protein N-acetyltransferase
LVWYEGSEVFLTRSIPQDALKWRNDPRVYRWCRQHSPISEAHHTAWLKRIEDDPTLEMFGVHVAMKGPVGVCGLTSIDRVNQKAEFSLYIASDHQGKGYGEKALYTLTRHGHEAFNIVRIWGESFDGNPAIRMFERLGYKYEGALRKAYFREGRFIDSHIYSCLRGELKDVLS